ncbi:MAG: BatD family protein, partial [Myxococcota bacterium]
MHSAQRTICSLAALAVVFLCPAAAWAQKLSVQTELSDPSVGVGEPVTLAVTVTARISGAMQVDIPEVDGLIEVSRQQSQSQSIQWSSAGQQVLIQQVFTVAYRTTKPGRFTLGPITARVGRRSARSTPVTLKVLGESELAAAAEDAKPNVVTPPDRSESDLFMRYRVNRSEPYLGQAVLLDLEVLSRPNQSFQVEETTGLPDVDGFWSQILEQPRRLKPRRVTIGGRQYVSYRIWRAALFPLKSGVHTLPPVAMQFSQGGGLFQLGRRMRRRTKPLKLDVKPLPSEGRPSDFVTTNVGSYRLKATVDQRRVKAGKALLYTVRLSGKGNISSAKLPTLESVPGFRVFAPTVRDDIKTNADGISGYKEAEYLMMPQKGGRILIPAVKLPIFDPVAGRYKTLRTKALRVFVEGKPDPTTAAADPPPTNNQKELPTIAALRPLRFKSSLASAGAPPWQSSWFWLLLFAPGLGSGARAAWSWSKQKRKEVTPRTAQKAAVQQAQALLEQAQQDVDGGALAEAHAKVADALRTCGSEMLGISLQGLTFEAVTQT